MQDNDGPLISPSLFLTRVAHTLTPLSAEPHSLFPQHSWTSLSPLSLLCPNSNPSLYCALRSLFPQHSWTSLSPLKPRSPSNPSLSILNPWKFLETSLSRNPPQTPESSSKPHSLGNAHCVQWSSCCEYVREPVPVTCVASPRSVAAVTRHGLCSLGHRTGKFTNLLRVFNFCYIFPPFSCVELLCTCLMVSCSRPRELTHENSLNTTRPWPNFQTK